MFRGSFEVHIVQWGDENINNLRTRYIRWILIHANQENKQSLLFEELCKQWNRMLLLTICMSFVILTETRAWYWSNNRWIIRLKIDEKRVNFIAEQSAVKIWRPPSHTNSNNVGKIRGYSTADTIHTNRVWKRDRIIKQIWYQVLDFTQSMMMGAWPLCIVIGVATLCVHIYPL